jgi:ribonuclease HII
MSYPDYEYENKLYYNNIVGVDEVGRGGGCGPVVSAACRIPEEQVDKFKGRVRDSKKMSEKKRNLLYDELISCCDYGLGIIDNNVIDEINILEATKLAMREAIDDVEYCECVLIDGPIELAGLPIPQFPIIKGDDTVLSIAAASIIAKVSRDRIMYHLHSLFPIYGWNRNKGYLTKEHREALKLYGPTIYHRKSFKGVVV